MTDVRTIFAIQGIRAFMYGFASILIGSSLAEGGFTAGEVGAVFTAMLAGMAISTLAVGRWGERIGRRRAYAWLLVLMAVAGLVFALADWTPLLILAALTGTLSTDANESGPITSLETAMLAGVPPEVRGRVYGRYNAVAYLAGAIGALAAGVPGILREAVPALPADQRWLAVLALGGLLCALLARRLSRDVEAPAPATADLSTRGLQRSRGAVRQLAALFAVDAFAGGLIVQSFLAFWFARQFGADIQLIGLGFFGVGLLQAASSVAAGWLGDRIGLVNTMVFTHLPSNVLLALIPFAPTLPIAFGLLLARSVLSQMDVPARQAFVVALVDPSERTAAAAYTNAARHLARPVAPILGGALMQSLWIGAPFVLAGGIKALYDIALYVRFRRALDRDGGDL
ncbi:MAG: MFS transporter [Candidatus Limnocylindria bacterium]